MKATAFCTRFPDAAQLRAPDAFTAVHFLDGVQGVGMLAQALGLGAAWRMGVRGALTTVAVAPETHRLRDTERIRLLETIWTGFRDAVLRHNDDATQSVVERRLGRIPQLVHDAVEAAVAATRDRSFLPRTGARPQATVAKSDRASNAGSVRSVIGGENFRLLGTAGVDVAALLGRTPSGNGTVVPDAERTLAALQQRVNRAFAARGQASGPHQLDAARLAAVGIH